MDVTVAIPVYNPGRAIDSCLDSLRAQTLETDRFEAIFVDDGSTDGTGERLEEIAASTPWMKVIRQENSGWSGKPRNVATDAAQGTFVQYLDQDDELAPNALRLMFEAADTNGTDIVIGKVTSNFRGVPHHLFRENIARCDVHETPLFESLTPHKMFRTKFLRDNEIRWAEGRRRLEDQLFMAQAYFTPGATASIVADEVCYRYLRREDGQNAGYGRLDPDGYFGNLREVLDAVEERVPPGEFRDTVFARFLRVEIMNRLAAKRLDRYDDAYRQHLFDVVTGVVIDRMPDSVDAQAHPVQRSMAHFARRRDMEGVLITSRAADTVRGKVELEELTWDGPRLVLSVAAHLTVDGVKLTLDERDGDLYLPRSLFGDGLPAEALRIGPDPGPTPVDVIIQHRESRDQWFAGPSLQRSIERTTRGAVVRWHGQVVIDPETAAGGHPLAPGIHDLQLRIWAFGFRRDVRIGPLRSAGVPSSVLVAPADGPLIQHYVTTGDGISLDLDPRPAVATKRIPRLQPIVTGGRLRVVAPLVLADASQVEVRLRHGADERVLAAQITARRGPTTTLESDLRGVRRGAWTVAVVVRGSSAGHGPVRLSAGGIRVGLVGRTALRAVAIGRAGLRRGSRLKRKTDVTARGAARSLRQRLRR